MALFGSDAYSPREIAQRVEEAGVAKARLPLLSLVMLGLLAGAFIGLGSLYYVIVVSDPTLPHALQRVLGGVVFSLGLLLVVVAGAELFTGNNLIAMAWADGKVTSGEVLRNWAIVCAANFAGAAGLAALALWSGHAGQYAGTYLKIAAAKSSLPIAEAFFLGVLCNVLVCLAVWMALAGRSHVDIVVNVAGWGKTEPFVKNTPELWNKLIQLNLMGPIQVTRAFVEPMIERQAGKIVSVASDAGRVGSLGETVYSGTKGGVIAFTKGLARELARYNINVNCVCPGPTDTPLMAVVPDKIREAFERATPMRRLARPAEVADAILFFASPRSDFVTGQVLSVSGGLTMAG